MDNHKPNKKVRCVIYDCDGVLFDSLEANGRLYSDVCVAIGRAPLNEKELKYVHCHTVGEAILFISGNDGELEEKARSVLRQTNFRNYVKYLKMEPHLLEALDRLKEKGILRAIDTNRTTSMPYIMEDFNLRPYFEIVVTALDVKNPKPHPESVEKILKAFNLKKEEVLFVGDSEVDQATGRAAGVRFVAYKNPDISDGLLIEDHLDLLKIV